MFAIRVFLAGGVVRDLLATGERADDAKTVDAAGKVRYPHIVLRMHAAARRVDDREALGFAVALLDQVDGLLDIDDVFDLLRPEQQDVEIAALHFLLHRCRHCSSMMDERPLRDKHRTTQPQARTSRPSIFGKKLLS